MVTVTCDKPTPAKAGGSDHLLSYMCATSVRKMRLLREEQPHSSQHAVVDKIGLLRRGRCLSLLSLTRYRAFRDRPFVVDSSTVCVPSPLKLAPSGTK